MAKKDERVVETRLGSITLPEDRVLNFPRGLIGFMGHREFTLIRLREESPFMVLQSLSDPKLGLLVTDPYSFMTEYEVVIGEPDRRLLGIERREQTAVLVTVTIPQGMPERTTLNLSGPIIINNETRIGLQIPQTDSRYPAHFIPGMVPVEK
ncbi:flagellar assembly protein FliW [Desulfovibrio sp. JY]|nr:flagellar assembly protein FliW [Desulfovibrio sp. JY]